MTKKEEFINLYTTYIKREGADKLLYEFRTVVVPDIREGENSLTDVWFEFCARRMAKERGIDPTDTEALDKLIDEAWETCPPDPRIDFRMSFVRRKGYRV